MMNSPLNSIRFRDAILDDALGISIAHVRSWQESYKGIVPEAHLNSLDPSSRAKMWAERFKDPSYDGHVIVAEDINKNIVGFIGLGPSRSQEYPSWGEVRAIYLLNDFKGLGIGRQLFELGKQRLRALGYRNFFCWVLKDNPTRRFYEASGGSLSGNEKVIQIGGSDLVEVAYEWTIRIEEKIASSAYSRCYANPLVLKRGDTVAITKPEDKENPQWAGWIGCESKTGVFGWVHRDFLQVSGANAISLQDYTAWELNAQPNEVFKILDDKSGWYWCESLSGERGWLPYETFVAETSKVCIHRPTEELAKSFLEFVDELRKAGEPAWEPYLPKSNEDIKTFVDRLNRREIEPEGTFVPELIYWGVFEGQVIGRISLRFKLEGNLHKVGGHIGYEVHPSFRRRGFAKELLKQVLSTPKAKEIGNLLLTCSPTNPASNRTIVANGGKFKETIFVDFIGEERNHYWIDLKGTP